MRPRRLLLSVLLAAIAAALPAAALLATALPASARGSEAATAPGAPGAKPDWAPADKHGFGTSTTLTSNVWFTLEGGELTEVYYPRIDTPSFRDLQFVVTDGHSFAELERDSTVQQTVQTDPRSLSFEQINTDKSGRWRLEKTYTVDPSHATVMLDVRFQSLTGRPYRLYVLADPSLDNDGAHDTGACSGGALETSDGHIAAVVSARPGLDQTSCGYKGTASDGGNVLLAQKRIVVPYRTAPDGNVVETGRTVLTGLPGRRHMSLAIGFGSSVGAAASAVRGSLRSGPATLAARYAAGWHAYLSSLKRPPSSLATAAERREYLLSAMVLAASEDKTFRGAYVASPTMPWAWGTGLQNPSGPYHDVWSRDLYEIATALIADGDVAGAHRALQFLFDRQQQPDGSFPQNSDITGTPVLTNLQLDEVSDPIILAWELGSTDPATYSHVKRAADFIVGFHENGGPPTHTAPYTPQERWENQGGYSPATIAAEIAGLVCAADIAKDNGDTASAAEYLRTADDWRAHLNAWTLTSTGPYSSSPYYLRLTKDGDPNAATTYSIGDSGPAAIDQRAVVDPSFLELVRLGIVPANDSNILNTIAVVDEQLSTNTGTGEFWHRYTDDGYGEMRDGSPWAINQPPGSQTTIGRVWPIFAGERGEYELAAGQSAGERLAAMASSANDAGLLPEQVWDQKPPFGQPGFPSGTPTFSATPLAWTHAQLIRLAWSISAGAPVEQPSVVACRYVRHCTP